MKTGVGEIWKGEKSGMVIHGFRSAKEGRWKLRQVGIGKPGTKHIEEKVGMKNSAESH
jgi:hypothetical protein